jgi:hypothetical protein
MRSWWQQYRLLLRLVMIVAGGVAAGFVAAVWVPASWAGVLGGSLTAAVTAIFIAAQTEWQKHAALIRSLPGALEISSARGGFPLVRDLSDPIAVGVHPSVAIDVAGLINRVPPYVTRDVEPELHAALKRKAFVILVGESASGKTRSAFESVRMLMPEARFVAPASRSALSVLLEVMTEADDYVVWLDDLERFLGGEGLTTPLLRRLQSRRATVLATMRSHEYDRYRDRGEIGMLGTDREVWRESRAVLRQAEIVEVDRYWTAQEQSRAQAQASDHRLAQALTLADRFGVAEILAAGPELAQAWSHAWTPGRHPRGAALVAAAVNARRSGYHLPLPLDVLDGMHTAYLEERGGPQLRPEPFSEAVLWASTPTFPNGANSLLIGSAELGYLAFDYLIDLPDLNWMPNRSWQVLVDNAAGPETHLIAEYALRSGRHQHALMAYRRAAEAGYAPAEAALADIGEPFRPPPESLERAHKYLQQVRNEFGSDHERSILAEQSVIMLTFSSGRYEDALTMADLLWEKSEVILGPEHRLVLAAQFTVAQCKFLLGYIDGGLTALDAAVYATERALGPSDTATAGRRITIVRRLIEAGRLDQARERLTALQEAYSGYPVDHFISIWLQEATGMLNCD